MKKIIFISICILGFGSFMFFLSGEEKDFKTNKAAPVKAYADQEKRESLKKSKYKIPAAFKSFNTFPKECSSSLSDLASMTAEEYKDLVFKKDAFITFFGEVCSVSLLKNSTFNELIKNSRCELFEGKSESKTDSCITMMFMLKAYFIADHTAGMSPEEMTSQELAANFVKMFFSLDKLTKSSFKDNLKIINRLQELHPHDPDVLEAYLGYMMIGKQITGEASVDSKIDSLMLDSIGDSFKVDRLQVLKNVLKNDLVATKASLEQLSQLYPKEPELAYYYAAYHWKQGNRKMALSYLKKAINLGENCSYCTPGLYEETRRKLSKAKLKDEKLFQMSIGLNFENL